MGRRGIITQLPTTILAELIIVKPMVKALVNLLFNTP